LCRYWYCVCEGAASPWRAKTSSPGRKTVLGPSRGGTGEESVCKRDPLGGGGTAWALAQQSAAASWIARCGVHFRAGLEASRNLTLMVKERGPCHKNAVGEVERRDDTAGT
jgi:hypothetical protein